MPTLVLWGLSDRIFPAQQARNAAARLRNGRLEILPRCGHLPHVERPDAFATIVDRFLADGASG
jgi:pimeloyl-ACP methyl ester carboxylesterase